MSEENPSNPATTEEQESLQTQIELFVHPDAKKATTLADAAASPETLAKGLSELLGAESAEDLLRGALNYLSSTVSFAQAERPRHVDTITEVSAFAEDSEQLQMIKARTMYQMVEELEEGKVKLLFLTNPQAVQIASSPEGIQRMLDALEVKKPSLVIELLGSIGFRGDLDLNVSFGCDRKPAFLSHEDERIAEAKLDRFMADVIIPLAAQTSAVVLCDAVSGKCILSTSFLRMFSVARAKWSGPPPFVVLSTTNSMQSMYFNQHASKEDAYWKTLRKASRAWWQRDAKLTQVHGSSNTTGPQWDLDPNASIILITDQINPKKDKFDTGPYSALVGALVRHLSASVPSLAIKTGFSSKSKLGYPSKFSLDMPSGRAQSGTAVLALDVRERAPLIPATTGTGAISRADLIELAKEQIGALNDSFLEKDLTESFDVCTLAYLHDVLADDRNAITGVHSGATHSGVLVPLHEAIKQAHDNEGNAVEDGKLPRATPEQIADTADWVADRIFRDVWRKQDCKQIWTGTSPLHPQTFSQFHFHVSLLIPTPLFF